MSRALKKLCALFAALSLAAAAGCSAELPASAGNEDVYERALYQGGSYDGDAIVQSVNIITSGAGNYLCELTFTRADSTPLLRTPEFEASYAENPARVIIRGKFLDFSCDEVTIKGGVSAFFVRNGEYAEIYLQFDGYVVTTAKEERASLVISASKMSGNDSELFYVLAELPDDKTSLSDFSISMSPALSDGRILSITNEGFESKDEAEAYALSLQESLGLPADGAAVAAFSGGLIETAFVNDGIMSAMKRLVELKGPDGDIPASFWAYDARFLTWLGGKRALFARSQSAGALWAYDIDGTKTRLDSHGVITALKAAPSPDGRFFAITDGSAHGERALIIYDTLSKKSYDLSEAGMGAFTADFCWGEDGRLYSISGDLTYSRLMAFDPSAFDSGGEFVYPIGHDDIPGSQIAAGGGRLFFTDVNDTIWTSSLSAGEPIELTDGDSFLLSPSGGTLCVTYYEGEPYTDDTGLKLFNVKNGETTVISTGVPVLGACYSLTGDRLHYLLKDEQNHERPALLHTYYIDEKRTVFNGSLETDEIFAMPEGNIGLTLYINADGVAVPVTYRLKLN